MVDQFQSRERFSNRVENYVKFRPGYPDGVFQFARDELGVTPESVIADLGSGTGIFTERLLSLGSKVFAVEPNAAMRQAAENALSRNSRFVSVNGSAEETTLPDQSIDLVTAAQAFHWFDVQKVKAEMVRILRPTGQAMLVWNDRKTSGTPFLNAYEQFLNRFPDYRDVGMHTRFRIDSMQEFFAPGELIFRSIPSSQELNEEAFIGRVLSSSYVPAEGTPQFPETLEKIRLLFEEYQQAGIVTFEYETVVFAGSISIAARSDER